jgi:hypothetical protein
MAERGLIASAVVAKTGCAVSYVSVCSALMKRKRIRQPTQEELNSALLNDLIKSFPRARLGRRERELVRALDNASDERSIHAFLKKHPYLVGMAFHSNSHPCGVVSEFKLGAEFRCDFLVLSCCSAWWAADFVELKPPNARLYLRDGTPSKSLRIANREIRDWKQWSRENEPYLRSRLSDFFESIDLCASGASQIPDAATEIRDPRCALTTRFHIVIGRRNLLSPHEQRARIQDSLDSGVGIATYDRLVDAARRYDRANQFDKSAFRYRKG